LFHVRIFVFQTYHKGADNRKVVCSASDSESDRSITNDSAVHFSNWPIRFEFSRSIIGAPVDQPTTLLTNVLSYFLKYNYYTIPIRKLCCYRHLYLLNGLAFPYSLELATPMSIQSDSHEPYESIDGICEDNWEGPDQNKLCSIEFPMFLPCFDMDILNYLPAFVQLA
jgi:hypothetical protein